MSADEPDPEVMMVREGDQPESVVIRPNVTSAVARVAGSAPALALAALVTATASMLTMAVANDIGDARLYSSGRPNNLEVIRWAAGTRLIVAGVALLLAVVAGMRYARDLPATRFVFPDDDEEPQETTEGAEPPGWVALLVGSGVVVAVIAVALNAVALVFALVHNESPAFGLG